MQLQHKQIYASVKNSNIGAVLAQSFRFEFAAQACQKLEYLKAIFIKPHKQIKHPNKEVLILWIEGYDITAAEAKKGATGNFAAITYKEVTEVAGGGKQKYTLYATKIESEIKYHPQRARPKAPHPNWGHPTLRWVKAKRKFQTQAAAQKLLDDLHAQYPLVSVPLIGKLEIFIYSRGKNKDEKPIKKYFLHIKQDDDVFYIDAAEKKQKTVAMRPLEAQQEPKEEQGKFTKMILAKRAKKKR